MNLKELKKKGIGFEAAPSPFEPGNPILVMIHGAGGRADLWKNQFRPLKSRMNLLALDLPGHGKTAEQGKDSIEAYARWVEKVLGDLSPEPVFLLGHSMGGAVVLEAALSCPERLSGIILVGTGARLPVAPAILEGLVQQFQHTVDRIIGYAYAPDADPVLLREGARLMKEAGPGILHGDFLACDRFDRRQGIPGIHAPCLIVCGEKDMLAPPAFSKKLNASIPGSRLVTVPGAGHMVMIEKFKAFNQAIEAFMSDMQA